MHHFSGFSSENTDSIMNCDMGDIMYSIILVISTSYNCLTTGRSLTITMETKYIIRINNDLSWF